MVSEMCQKKQFYHHKNVWTVYLVKFEFPGYNVYNENGKSFHPAIPPMLGDGDGVITLSSSRRRGCSIRDVCMRA